MTLNNIKHSGKYYCHSSNSRGSTVEMVDVTVLSPFQRHGDHEGIIYPITNLKFTM